MKSILFSAVPAIALLVIGGVAISSSAKKERNDSLIGSLPAATLKEIVPAAGGGGVPIDPSTYAAITDIEDGTTWLKLILENVDPSMDSNDIVTALNVSDQKFSEAYAKVGNLTKPEEIQLIEGALANANSGVKTLSSSVVSAFQGDDIVAPTLKTTLDKLSVENFRDNPAIAPTLIAIDFEGIIVVEPVDGTGATAPAGAGTFNTGGTPP